MWAQKYTKCGWLRVWMWRVSILEPEYWSAGLRAVVCELSEGADQVERWEGEWEVVIRLERRWLEGGRRCLHRGGGCERGESRIRQTGLPVQCWHNWWDRARIRFADLAQCRHKQILGCTSYIKISKHFEKCRHKVYIKMKRISGSWTILSSDWFAF